MSYIKRIADKKLILLPVGEILPNPMQPRRNFDEYEMSALAESIKMNGLLQPLTVRKTGDGYELIAGERRLRAAIMAGLKKVPCILQRADMSQAAFFTIIENLQRSDLTIFEEAEGINRLIECCGMSRLEAADKLGIAQSTLSNKLRLLKLSEDERRRIIAARLTERHARALLRIENEKQRNQALDHILAKGLTVSEAEEYIANLLNPNSKEEEKPLKKAAIGDVRIFANSLNRIVKTMVLSGLNAKTSKRETKHFIEYKVVIAKAEKQSEENQMRLISL